MELLQVLLTALFSIVVMFVITKIIGCRQLSEMSLFDYINGITIGSIGAELATAEKKRVVPILIAMVIYGVITVLVSLLSDKSLKLRTFFVGNPIILMTKGKLYYDNFKRARLDINEFLTKCRGSGYFDLSQLDTVILEPNGRLSFLPVSMDRPLTPNDMKVPVKQEELVSNVIIDGKIVEKNLSVVGRDRKWLTMRLKEQNVFDCSTVFLATCSPEGQLTVYERNKKKPEGGIGQ